MGPMDGMDLMKGGGGGVPAVKPLAGTAVGSAAPAGPAGPAAIPVGAPPAKKGFWGKLGGALGAALPGKLPGMPGGVNKALTGAKQALPGMGAPKAIAAPAPALAAPAPTMAAGPGLAQGRGLGNAAQRFTRGMRGGRR